MELDPGGSSLSVTRNTLLFPFILDPLLNQQRLLLQYSNGLDSRISEYKVASDEHISNIQFLVLRTRRESLAEDLRLHSLRVLVVALQVR